MAQLNDTQVNGDLDITGTLTTNMGGGQHPLLDLIHPVGAVILTRDPNFNPQTYWGGTWKKWTDGYIKCDTSTNVQEASAQGTTNYKITTDMLPSHQHTYTPSGKISKTTDLNGYIKSRNLSDGNSIIFGSDGTILSASSIEEKQNSADYRSQEEYVTKTTINVNHSHTFTATQQSTDPSGGGQEYKPRYYAVLAWQRTA